MHEHLLGQPYLSQGSQQQNTSLRAQARQMDMNISSMPGMCAAGSGLKPISWAPCSYAFRNSRGSCRRRRRTAKCIAGNANAFEAHTRRGLLGAAALLSASTSWPAWAAEKQAMPVDELKRLLMRDFQERQYYITGWDVP